MTERDPRDELIGALFDAARRERPSPALRDRVLAGTGVTPVAREIRTGKRRQVFALLAVAAAVGLAVLVAAPHRTDPTISLSPEPASKAPETVPDPSSQPEVREPAPVARTPKRVARLPASAPPMPVPPASATPDPRHSDAIREATPPSLSDEISMLDRARVALATDPAKSLEILDDYDQVLHGTRLVAEASLLRIEALARAGRQAAASDLAKHFVDANPGSALAERARAFITPSSPGAAPAGVDAGAGTR
jgi:hypothetical protein